MTGSPTFSPAIINTSFRHRPDKPRVTARPHGRQQSTPLYIRYGILYNPFRTTTEAAMLGRIARKEVDWGPVSGGFATRGQCTFSVYQRNATQPAACFLPVVYRQTVQNGARAEAFARSRRAPPSPRSIPQRKPVLARLGTADQHPALPVDLDDLAAAHAFRLPLDLVAAADEVGGDLPRDGVLEAQHPLEGVAARRVRRFLRVAAAVDHLGEDLDVADRLVVAAHDAERHHRAAVLHGKTRDDRMHRPLARRDRVGMTGHGAEAHAAIMQDDTGFRRVDAAAETGEERVDEGDRVAVAVDDREIGGVLVLDRFPMAARQG